MNGRFELNVKTLNDIMRSGEMQQYLDEVAGKIMNDANSMKSRYDALYSSKVKVLTWTAVAKVYPNGQEADEDNLENNTLLKAASNSGLPNSK